MSLLKKRLTLGGITASFSKVLADLAALQEQNATDIAKHNVEIADKQAKVASLTTEANEAAAVHKNITALIKV